MKQRDPAALGHYLAWTVGAAHAAQMSLAERRSWRRAIKGRGSADIPPWLWASAVALLGIYDVAYLDHCRIAKRP